MYVVLSLIPSRNMRKLLLEVLSTTDSNKSFLSYLKELKNTPLLKFSSLPTVLLDRQPSKYSDVETVMSSLKTR